jgi:pimeloyl-ACP methyl ester carboxylesterase
MLVVHILLRLSISLFLLSNRTVSLVLHHSVLLAATATSTKLTTAASIKSACDVVILHGLLGSARNFNSFARILHKNLLGSRNIVVTKSLLDYGTMAADVIETLDYLSIKTFHVIGHSMGGKTAAVLALDRPLNVKSLAVLDIRYYTLFIYLQIYNIIQSSRIR